MARAAANALVPLLSLESLSEKQRAFVGSRKAKVHYEGGFRSGKTVAGVFRTILLAYHFPKNRILVARNTYRKLFDTTVNSFYDWCPKELIAWERKKEDKLFLYDKAGSVSEIMWRSLDRESDFGNVKNLDLGAVWLDQAEEFPEDVYKALLSRLTLQGIGYRSLYMTANPPVTDLHWLAKYFPYDLDEAVTRWRFGGDDWEIILGDTQDNAEHLPPDYAKGLLQDYDDDWAEIYVHGRRGAVKVGIPVLTAFARSQHVIPQSWSSYKGEIKGTVRYLRSWDFGRVRPGVLWAMLVYPYDNPHQCVVTILHEYLGDNITTPQLAKEVLEQSKRHLPFVNTWIDVGDPRSAWKANEATGTRICDLLRDERINLVRLGYSDPNGRADLINRHFMSTTCGRPRLQIMQNCQVLIAGCGGGYHRKKPQPGKLIDDMPVKDGYYEHLIDALGYIAQYMEGGQAMAARRVPLTSNRYRKLVSSYGMSNPPTVGVSYG